MSIIIWFVYGIILFLFLIPIAYAVLRSRWVKLRFYRWKYKSNFLRIILICPNNRAIEHFGFIEANLTIAYTKSETYVVDPIEVIYLNNIPSLFYVRGNPNPLHFGECKNMKVTVNSENLKLVMNQKIIKDLLSENNMLLYILIAVIGVGVICVGIALKVFGVIKNK